MLDGATYSRSATDFEECDGQGVWGVGLSVHFDLVFPLFAGRHQFLTRAMSIVKRITGGNGETRVLTSFRDTREVSGARFLRQRFTPM